MTKKGYTLIEVIVVIVVVAILATIVVLGYTRFQQQSRDAQRSANVIVISEALEKYYDQNGLYPSCATMTGAALSVSTVLSIDESVLQAPRDTTENSFTCTTISSGGDADKYGYIGDISSDCATGDGCSEWVIQYRNEERGLVEEIESRRNSSL